MIKNFIVLSHPRSGTTYLNNFILSSHNKIKCFDELFNLTPITLSWLNRIYPKTLNDFPYKNYKMIFSPRIALKLYISDFSKKARIKTGKEVIGFKLFPGHLTSNEIIYIVGKLKIPIILLRRKNLIQAAVSYEIAKMTNQWDHRDKKPLEELTISLDRLEKFLDYYPKVLSKIEQYAEEKNIHIFKCYYENLFNLKNINRILEYLMLDPINSIPQWGEKLNTPDRYRKIKNLEQIQNKFCNRKNGYLFIK